MLPLFVIENCEEKTNSDTSKISAPSEVDLLYEEMEKVNKEQGLISSLWNDLKCITNIGSSTEKCEKAIEKYKNGEISFEEASQKIAEFQSKQKNSVNIFANVLTGLTAVAVVGSAIASGGLSLGVIALGAGVGAGTKAGLKFLDRATNKVQGDAVDAKQIAKDALSGATDGAISVATMGIGSSALVGKTITEQTVKQTVIQGVKMGAFDGAVSGAVTGASDYAIEAAFEENVEFDGKEMLKTASINGIVGGVLGGVLGGASSKIRHQKALELKSNSNEMAKTYKANIDEATEQIETAFKDVKSINEVTGRPKSEESIFDKLFSKFTKRKLKSTNINDCNKAVADAYGTRIQIKNLTKAQDNYNQVETPYIFSVVNSNTLVFNHIYLYKIKPQYNDKNELINGDELKNDNLIEININKDDKEGLISD